MPSQSDPTDRNKNKKTNGTKKGDAKQDVFITTWLGVGVASVVWWAAQSHGDRWRFALSAAISIAAFMVGSLVGFLFSSHGEETDTIGKVRDWVIGGITTLTIAKAGSIKATIMNFEVVKDDREFAIAFGAAVAYFALGFAFMYFLRELYLNPLLAERRRERGIIEGTRQVDQVVKSSYAKLPPSILAQGPDVNDISNPEKKEAANKLRDDFFSHDVDAFIEQVTNSVDQCAGVDWDDVTKVANIEYYRTYFVEKNEKPAQAKLAIEWIQRALLFNPHNVDLITKYADMLTVTQDYTGAIGILERLVRQPDAPLMVRQWLGYFLLYVPHRAADAIRYSNEYRQLVGEDADSLFNIACAYAQAYCEGAGAEPGLEDPAPNHASALEYLKLALQKEPDYASNVLNNWAKPGESFACFAQDPEFLALVSPKPATPAPSPAAPSGGPATSPSAAPAGRVPTTPDPAAGTPKGTPDDPSKR